MSIQRKQRLIDTSLQLKLIGAFMAVACLASLFQVVLLNFSMLRLANQSVVAGDLILSHLPGLLTQNIALTLGVLIPAMALVGLVITHRIAGPAYAIEKYLRKVAETGETDTPCRIRKGDELQSLCATVNEAVGALSNGRPSSAEHDEETTAEENTEPPSLATGSPATETEAPSESPEEVH